MPAKSKRPSPPARMVELLVARKRELILEPYHGPITIEDFEAAWESAWQVMVTERAWPHATEHRRTWRLAMEDCKSEMQACFTDAPSAFQRAQDALIAAMDRSRFANDQVLHGQLVA